LNDGSGPPIATSLNKIVGLYTDICDSLAVFREGELPGNQESLGMSSGLSSALIAVLNSDDPNLITPSWYAFLTAAYRDVNTDPKIQAAIALTNIKALAQTNQAWLAGNLEQAKSDIEVVNPINAEESMLKSAWQIRLNAELSGLSGVWSGTDRSALEDIALSNLREGGSAVVFAQSLLGLTIVPDEWEIMEAEERVSAKEEFSRSIFPNPAQSVIYIQNAAGGINLSITDLHGKLLLSQPLTDVQIQQININSLPNGIYTVAILSENGPLLTEKLFIAR
jgi:hypothetical protein